MPDQSFFSEIKTPPKELGPDEKGNWTDAWGDQYRKPEGMEEVPFSQLPFQDKAKVIDSLISDPDWQGFNKTKSFKDRVEAYEGNSRKAAWYITKDMLQKGENSEFKDFPLFRPPQPKKEKPPSEVAGRSFSHLDTIDEATSFIKNVEKGQTTVDPATREWILNRRRSGDSYDEVANTLLRDVYSNPERNFVVPWEETTDNEEEVRLRVVKTPGGVKTSAPEIIGKTGSNALRGGIKKGVLPKVEKGHVLRQFRPGLDGKLIIQEWDAKRGKFVNPGDVGKSDKEILREEMKKVKGK